MFAYVAPSLDTTILGAGHMLLQLGRNPVQFAKVKNDRSLIMVMYQSANHDERRYADPGAFDVERDARDHDAMARKVNTIEVDDPTPFPSNMVSGFASMRTAFA